MKNAIYFVAGILFIALISATTISVITVKPAMPKKVVIYSTQYGSDDIKFFIREKTKAGYIVKSLAGTSQYGYNWIVIMEKY